MRCKIPINKCNERDNINNLKLITCLLLLHMNEIRYKYKRDSLRFAKRLEVLKLEENFRLFDLDTIHSLAYGQGLDHRRPDIYR